MSGLPHNTEVAYEQSVNQSYLASLAKRLAKPLAVGMTRNEMWLKGYPSLGRSLSALHPLVGRVGLESGDDLVPRTFYIGPMHHTWDGSECFSWAAPIATVFFQPDRPFQSLDAQVVIRRTFDTRIDNIVGMNDEWVRPTKVSPFSAPELVLPPPPPPGVGRRRLEVDSDSPSIILPVQKQTPHQVAGRHLTEGMRVKEAVLQRLRSPRSEHLTSVLATLQPDQHHLAAAPDDEALIIQGHPGTGKTIIAAYRAAHLTDPEREGRLAERVLLVGPTQGYVNHVMGLIAPLADPRRVRVVDMQTFLVEVAGLRTVTGGALDGVADDVDAYARGLADAAARLVIERQGWKSGPGARKVNLRSVYELVRSNGDSRKRLSVSPDRIRWMRSLPEYEKAVKLRRYLPLMAQCGLSIQAPPRTDQFDHIIVDEAQDVSPIEWNVIDQFNRGRCWTLLGDLNQRRSDSTYSSWSQIADHLGIGRELEEIAPVVIKRGYRSTQPILRFADRLLPRALRGAESLQVDGPPVVVKRAPMQSAIEQAKVAVAELTGLRDRHPLGTVAVITVDPGPLYQALFQVGWRRQKGDEHSWAKDDGRIAVHVPESARGLEFDGVVVFEPAAFPKNLGRAGQLYTSLTRANRELIVVHHRALPDELRRAGRQE